MEGKDDALQARAQALLDHLDELPAVREALPFTVAYLLVRLRAAVEA